MNYLAHLHIADHCNSNALGNLLGDFVKGNPDNQYDNDVVQGIRLHRFVDSYTDSHELVREARQLFAGKQRRFSGIALDMFWDHCLASNWQQYNDHGLRKFCEQQRVLVSREHDVELPERFTQVTAAMWQGRWMESYQDLENIEYALQRMSNRSPRMGELANCFNTLDKNYADLVKVFKAMYPDVLNAAQRF
jgi:acyl carrier protein phosphodiesterase